MLENDFAADQCLCGEVKYTISSGPLRMAQCHCDDCRKSTCEAIELNCYINNEKGRHFWEVNAYKPIGLHYQKKLDC